jgi:hypothetical protein
MFVGLNYIFKEGHNLIIPLSHHVELKYLLENHELPLYHYLTQMGENPSLLEKSIFFAIHKW